MDKLISIWTCPLVRLSINPTCITPFHLTKLTTSTHTQHNTSYHITYLETSLARDRAAASKLRLANTVVRLPPRCCTASGHLRSVFGRAKDLFDEAYKECKEACQCLSCCFGCAWSCVQIWTPLTATFLIYWLLYRPDRFHPRTDSAVLTAFDFTNASLRYDLAVDLSFRNSHRLAIRYLDVAASVFYNGTRLGPTDDALPSFLQGPKNTTVLYPAFHGVVTVDSGVAAELQRERAAGTVHLRVSVSLTLMYKVLFVKDVFFYKYDCWLWFPPPRNLTPALFYGDGTKCWRV